MPNLENLKKQAKLILRWHRERHYPVAPQIREHLPRFLNMSDSEILAASFKVSDAQEMVARQHGFANWQALKTGLSTTSRKVKSSPSKATIVGAEPQLFVTDVKRSCEFFREKLGFSLVFSALISARQGPRRGSRAIAIPTSISSYPQKGEWKAHGWLTPDFDSRVDNSDELPLKRPFGATEWVVDYIGGGGIQRLRIEPEISEWQNSNLRGG